MKQQLVRILCNTALDVLVVGLPVYVLVNGGLAETCLFAALVISI